MAASNQERESKKVIKRVATPARAGQAEFSTPDSGLDRVGIPAAIALKSKKIVNLNLKGVSNY